VTFKQGEQGVGGELALAADRLSDRGQPERAGGRCVIEADDREIPRDLQSAGPGRLHSRFGKAVRQAQEGGRPG
jgi:hypothetical protein